MTTGFSDITDGVRRFSDTTTIGGTGEWIYNTGEIAIRSDTVPLKIKGDDAISIDGRMDLSKRAIESLKNQLGYGDAVIKCRHCGQWAAAKTACRCCGAPVDPD
jgi:hypothetical protein